MFELNFPTENLQGAKYNPRKIASDALEKLMRSITEVGFAKPIIVTRKGLIVAGHQRTKASRKLGRESVPAWVLPEITIADEVRFNQLHNGTDLDEIDKPVFVGQGRIPEDGISFEMVGHEQVVGDMRSIGAGIRNEICALILKYGNWGGAIANESGEVLSSPQYVLSCKILKIPARVFRIPNEKTEIARDFFGQQYGEFSYEHLARETWMQSFAQMFRLRSGQDGVEEDSFRSRLYENLVLPPLKKTERVLDFGCGQGDYVRVLRSQGYQVWGVEFFRRKGDSLDTGAVHRMCDELAEEIRLNGRFDVCLADSVLNSVDSLQAEADVLTCLSALCRPAGRIYFSGRRREHAEKPIKAATIAADHRRRIEFLDSNGMTALYRRGAWFYQKFHEDDQIQMLAGRYFGGLTKLRSPKGESSWQAFAFKQQELERSFCEDALRREFDLMWPGGRSVGRADLVIEAYRQALESEKN